MQITVQPQGTVTLATLNGRLDGSTSASTETKLLESCAAPGTRLVIDCSALEYVSSAGLRVFLNIAKKLKTSQGKVAVSSLQPNVKEVFEMSGFAQFLPVHADSASAVKSLS